MKADRMGEWFVPSTGSPSFRALVGLLFLPYTGMVLSYTVIGSMLAANIHWDRLTAIVVIYFLALGIGAHALDAIGSKEHKPWGNYFSSSLLWILALCSITLAYAIGTYYMLRYTPLLWLIAIPEGFFLLAYNLEWFEGRFHTDGYFALSWGSLPVLAGYIIQTNRVSVAAISVAASMGLLSLVEITASRPYKILKRTRMDGATGVGGDAGDTTQRFEAILKNLSAGVILLGAGLFLFRWFSPVSSP
jgi:hypothetical protein